MRLGNKIFVIFILLSAFVAYLFCFVYKSNDNESFSYDNGVALYIDNERADTLEKDILYKLDSFVCSNNETVNYDTYSKILSINAVNNNTRCKLYFNYLDEVSFDFTGKEETFRVPKDGYYTLEAWGAEGGYAFEEEYRGGYGSYSTGTIYLKKDTILKINVGGRGLNTTNVTPFITLGGYNGGGSATGEDGIYFGSGGGATHISKSSGLLSDVITNNSDLLIVAAGGGGAMYKNENEYGLGGNGGGFIGSNGKYLTNSILLTGGSENNFTSNEDSSGNFGKGGNPETVGAGAGSGYYGGLSAASNGGAGGGTGFIANLDKDTKYMSCYECEESETDVHKTKIAAGASDFAATNYAKKGNGYAKITLIQK